MSASAISSADMPRNCACSAVWSRTRSRGAIATTWPSSQPEPEPARRRTTRVPRPAARAPELIALLKALTSLRRSCGWFVSVMSAATSAARREISVASVSGSAMAYSLPLIIRHPPAPSARFSWAPFSWAPFSWAPFSWAPFSWAPFSWAPFSWAPFSWAPFSWAPFSWAPFSWAPFSWDCTACAAGPGPAGRWWCAAWRSPVTATRAAGPGGARCRARPAAPAVPAGR